MKILVCLKQILDPEIPPRDFRVDRERLEADPGNANLVTNIFCENALETALQLREASGGEITAVSFGPPSAEDSLRKALALKVDHAYHVLNTEQTHPSPALVARVLAAACRHLDGFDLIMVGREAGDWGAGQTGGLLAEELGLPLVAFVDNIEHSETGFQLKRQTDKGWEQVQARAPLVVAITNNDQNVPRIPKTRDIMMSSRKTITKLEPAELGLDDGALATSETEVVELYIPEKQVNCEFVEGDSLEEKIDAFADRIAQAVK